MNTKDYEQAGLMMLLTMMGLNIWVLFGQQCFITMIINIVVFALFFMAFLASFVNHGKDAEEYFECGQCGKRLGECGCDAEYKRSLN